MPNASETSFAILTHLTGIGDCPFAFVPLKYTVPLSKWRGGTLIKQRNLYLWIYVGGGDANGMISRKPFEKRIFFFLPVSFLGIFPKERRPQMKMMVHDYK